MDFRQKKNSAEWQILQTESECLEDMKRKIHLDILFNSDDCEIEYKVNTWSMAGLTSYRIEVFLFNSKWREQLLYNDELTDENPPVQILSKYPERIQEMIVDVWWAAFREAQAEKKRREQASSFSGFNKTTIPDRMKKKFIKVLLKNFHPDTGYEDEAIYFVNQLKEEWAV